MENGRGDWKKAVLRMTNKEVAKKPWLNFSLLEWVWILTALLQKPAFLPGPAPVSTPAPAPARGSTSVVCPAPALELLPCPEALLQRPLACSPVLTLQPSSPGPALQFLLSLCSCCVCSCAAAERKSDFSQRFWFHIQGCLGRAIGGFSLATAHKPLQALLFWCLKNAHDVGLAR